MEVHAPPLYITWRTRNFFSDAPVTISTAFASRCADRRFADFYFEG
jgi:hypothetical protein